MPVAANLWHGPAMKITSVTIHRLSMPLPRPVRTAIHNHAHADTVAVELQSDPGAVGSGYCFAFGAKRAAALAALVEDLAVFYEGKDPGAVVAHFEAAWRSINFIGHSGLAMIALSALDTACWDLAARAAAWRVSWSVSVRRLPTMTRV